MTGRGGFTLVEMLVVLTLLGLLLAGLSGVIGFGGRALDRTVAAGTDSQRMESVHRFLRGALSAAGEGAYGDAPALQGDADSLSVVTALPPHLATGGRAQLAVRVARDDAGGTALEAAWRPDLPRPSQKIPAVASTLADGLASARLAYFGRDAADAAPAWHDAWPAADRLPDLVRLTVVAGDGRPWPDLIVALPVRLRGDPAAPTP